MNATATTTATAHGFEIISAYTVDDAVADGVLINAKQDPRISAAAWEQFPRADARVFVTAPLMALIERAVASERHCNDYEGVMWDVVWMSRSAVAAAAHEANETGSGQGSFQVIITGTGRKRYHTVYVGVTSEGVTYMLREDL